MRRTLTTLVIVGLSWQTWRQHHSLRVQRDLISSFDRRLREHRAEPHAAYLLSRSALEWQPSAHDSMSFEPGSPNYGYARYGGYDVLTPPLLPSDPSVFIKGNPVT